MKYTKSDIAGLLLDILHAEDLTNIETRIAEIGVDADVVLRYARGVVWSLEDYLQDLETQIAALQSKIAELQSDRDDADKRLHWLKAYKKRLEMN